MEQAHKAPAEAWPLVALAILGLALLSRRR
jgi:MYXO-CTERM domain-containing protein